MYVSSSAPLPQNSLMPPPAWQVAKSKGEVARLNFQVARALVAYECGLSPSGYAEFGPAVVGQVSQANNLLNIAGQTPQSLQQMADATLSTPVDSNPPQVIPFNPIQMLSPPLNPPVSNPLNLPGPMWNDSLASSGKPCNAAADWISSHPWLVLLLGGIAAAGLAAYSQKKRRGRF
jgi:hypothetical protein